MIQLESLWCFEAPRAVRIGDVVDRRGVAIGLQRIIQRRWGWPKKASVRATEYLQTERGWDDDTMIPIYGHDRDVVQSGIIENVEDILFDLMEGIANRSQREARNGGDFLSGLTILLVDKSGSPLPVQDLGLFSSVLGVVANRLGVSVDHLRGASSIFRDENSLTVRIKVDGLD